MIDLLVIVVATGWKALACLSELYVGLVAVPHLYRFCGFLLHSQKLVFIKRFFPFEHIVNRCTKTLGNDRQCFSFAVPAAQSLVILPGQIIAPYVEQRGFGESPPQMCIADSSSCSAIDLSIRRLLSLHQAGIGAKTLLCRQTV